MTRLGLIGCGRIAPRHVDAIGRTEGLELVAVCDAVAERSAEIADPLGIPTYAKFGAMLDGTDMDAVVICRSAITAAVEVVQTTGVCFSPVPDAGSVQIEADGHVAEIDFSSSTDCSGCWEWTLDGVVQPDPTCSHGF